MTYASYTGPCIHQSLTNLYTDIGYRIRRKLRLQHITERIAIDVFLYKIEHVCILHKVVGTNDVWMRK